MIKELKKIISKTIKEDNKNIKYHKIIKVINNDKKGTIILNDLSY